jgi:hypothetical protein
MTLSRLHGERKTLHPEMFPRSQGYVALRGHSTTKQPRIALWDTFPPSVLPGGWRCGRNGLRTSLVDPSTIKLGGIGRGRAVLTAGRNLRQATGVRTRRTLLLVVAVAWATVTLAICSGSAGADQLCLDQAHNFVPCAAPTAALRTAGTVSASTKPSITPAGRAASPPATRVVPVSGNAPPTRPPARTHFWLAGAIPIPEGGVLFALAIVLFGCLYLINRRRRENREPEVAAPVGPRPFASAFPQNINGREQPRPLPARRDNVPSTPSENPPQTPEIPRSVALGGVRLHQLTIDSLAELPAKIDAVHADDDDMVLALPARATVVLGEPEELVRIAQLVVGICVAASAESLAAPALAEPLRQAVAESVGSPVLRCQCFPHALVGTAAQLRSLLADLPGGESDADRLTAAILANRHELVLDTVSFFFHILDGTGTDVTIVAGRAHVGGRQPLVLIDLAPDGQAMASAETDLADRGAGDLARLLRYDGAVSPGDGVAVPATDVRLTQLWSPSFCATVIRAAEVARLWTNHLDDDSTSQAGVSLLELIPRLSGHLEADLAQRIRPLLDQWQPMEGMALIAATVIRRQAGQSPQFAVAGHNVADIIGSVRLNDGYTGGALQLPNQHWNDSAAPVGALTLWPSGASHPHHVAPVTRGVKYALSLSFGVASSRRVEASIASR